jgi:hypothetical protein
MFVGADKRKAFSGSAFIQAVLSGDAASQANIAIPAIELTYWDGCISILLDPLHRGKEGE